MDLSGSHHITIDERSMMISKVLKHQREIPLSVDSLQDLMLGAKNRHKGPINDLYTIQGQTMESH